MNTPRPPRRRTLALVLAGLALITTVTLTACGDDDASDSSGAAVTAPVVVQVGELDGSTVEVAVGGTIDIVVPEASVATWTAEIADTSIAHFVPGRTDATATFNPGLVGDAAGDTDVKLDDPASGTTVSFSVHVKDN